LKYKPDFPTKPFSSLSKARGWVHGFVCWYNTEHHHSMIKFVTPEQRHLGEDIGILNHRKKVYKMAKKQHPERWSGSTRNWDHQAQVLLNPGDDFDDENKESLKAA